MMRIYKTETIGFCYGVARAVGMAEKIASEHRKGRVYTWGELIHNGSITEGLRRKGVFVTEDISVVRPGDTVIIRAHGIPDSMETALRATGAEVVDMTCPKVERIHGIAKNCDRLIVAGDPIHPEVIGIVGSCRGKAEVVSSPEQLAEVLSGTDNDPVTLISQTTFSVETWRRMCRIAEGFPGVRVIDTICPSTEKRQSEVEKLSREVDFFVIVGGKNSSNTKKLYQTALRNCPAILIESATGLPPDINKYKKIGLSSGASTPADMTEEVIYTMTNEIDNKIMTEEDIDFAAAVESMKPIRNGQRVKGIVSAVNGTEVQVDLGVKYTGIIPVAEFANDDKPVAVGDEVEAFVVKVTDTEGTALLSKKNLDSAKGLEKISAAFESGEVLTGKVTEIVKGGVVVNYSSVRVFIPASQATLRRDSDLEQLKDQTVNFRIIEVEGLNSKRKRIIGSIKSVLKEEKQKQADEVWATLETGKVYEGTVRSILPFGAFVDIGGVDGLVHITDMTWKRIHNPKEVVEVGDKVKVEVKSLDLEKRRISLTMKNESEDPWKILAATHQVGDEMEVEVLKVMPYGAFVSVIPDIDGLVHISQISNKRIAKVSDALTVGQKVMAKIIEIDYDAKKVSLSIKAVGEIMPDDYVSAPEAETEASAEAVEETPAE